MSCVRVGCCCFKPAVMDVCLCMMRDVMCYVMCDVLCNVLCDVLCDVCEVCGV